MKRTIKLTILLIVAAMLLGACTTQTTAPTTAPTTGGATTAATTTEAEGREVITLDLMMLGLQAFSDKINQSLDSPIFDEIEAQTGVRLTFTGTTGDQKDVILASRATTDIITVISTDECEALIQGEMVIPLDDLINEYAPNVRDLYPDRLESSRNDLSNGTGKVFFLPSNCGNGAPPQRIDIGAFTTRWDYYAAMGYPEVSSPEDMLDLLVDMQAAYPTTADGLKTYGISGTSASMAQRWLYQYQYLKIDNSNNDAFVDVMSCDIKFQYGDPDSVYWNGIKYLNQAYRLGILDPEILTQTEEDYTKKVTNGQVLSPDIRWLGILDFNATAEEKYGPGAGYVSLPVAGFVHNPGYDAAGWGPTFSLAICSTCQYPERAMELINYMYGYEGSRLVNSGVEGRDWTYVDGVPTLTNFAIAKWLTGGDTWEVKNLWTYFSNFFGIKAGTVCPDGGQVNLYQDSAIYSKTLISCDKSYCDYYQVSYPYEKILNMIEEGTAYSADEWDSRIATGTGAAGDDIARIDTKIENIAVTYVPQCVLAKTDAEFEALQTQMLSEMDANGYEQSVADWTARFEAAKAKYLP
ncbi:MAG TPA: hypothetical protein DD640_07400 [Clostridiales bacterium]|nr:hypothetical protein [Clostridiales bacterium]